MTTANTLNYVSILYERRHEGIMLKRAAVSIGDWTPVPNECHGNVTIWCENNTEYQPVRGWLYLDAIGMFLAHSVVRAADGELYDITPLKATRQYPFIIAKEPEAEYAELVEKRGIINLFHT